MHAPPGTIIDEKYTVIEAIAAGGFGVLYKANQVAFDRPVAVKVLNLQTADKEMVLRFEREAKILSALQHPNVVSIYGFGVWKGFPYISMEYLQGESLDTALRREGRLPVALALNIAKQVCSALNSAHNAGIVHRDLKPANIMICAGESRNNIKVIDFGLARLSWISAELQKLTEAGTTLGTAQYMSPEQCTGSVVDARSDVYAVGCILFKILTGESAFNGEHTELMIQHLRDTPPRMSQFIQSDKTIAELQLVIDKCMAKDPGDRYQSAVEIVDDLNAVGAAKPEPLIAEHTRPPKSNTLSKPMRAALPAVVAFVFSLIAASAFILNQPEAPKPISSVGLYKEFETLTGGKLYISDPVICKQALDLGEQVLACADLESLLLPERIVYVENVLAQASLVQGNHRKALDLARSSMHRLQVAGRWDAAMEASAEFARDGLVASGQKDEALNQLNAVLAGFKQNTSKTPYYLNYDLARMYFEKGDFDSAQRHLQMLEGYAPKDIYKASVELRAEVNKRLATAAGRK